MESINAIQRYRLSPSTHSHDHDGHFCHDWIRIQHIIQSLFLLHSHLYLHGNIALLHPLLIVPIQLVDDKEIL